MFEHTTKPITLLIDQVVDQVPGWSPSDQLLALFTLANSLKHVDGDIIEVGSWCGRSAVLLAQAARNLGKTKVHSIDLFPEKSDWFENSDGTFSFEVTVRDRVFGAYQEQTVWREPYLNEVLPVYSEHDSLLERFRTTLSEFGLSDEVIPFRGDLGQFLSEMTTDFKCRLAFVDGDHGYHAVKQDISLVDSILAEGGWICFDDAFTSYEGVDVAIRESIIDNPNYGMATQLTRKMFVAQKLRS